MARRHVRFCSKRVRSFDSAAVPRTASSSCPLPRVMSFFQLVYDWACRRKAGSGKRQVSTRHRAMDDDSPDSSETTVTLPQPYSDAQRLEHDLAFQALQNELASGHHDRERQFTELCLDIGHTFDAAQAARRGEWLTLRRELEQHSSKLHESQMNVALAEEAARDASYTRVILPLKDELKSLWRSSAAGVNRPVSSSDSIPSSTRFPTFPFLPFLSYTFLTVVEHSRSFGSLHVYNLGLWPSSESDLGYSLNIYKPLVRSSSQRISCPPYASEYRIALLVT